MSEQAVFSWPVRVYIEDTDAGGIVFYANYLKYLERARTEYLRSVGFELRQGMADGISYVVHSLELKYQRSARLDDWIEVHVKVEKVGRSYLLFQQWVTDEKGHRLVTARVKVACVNLDSAKPRALPSELVLKLT